MSRRDLVFDPAVLALDGHTIVCGYNAGVPSLLHELSLDEQLRGLPLVVVNELPDLSALDGSGFTELHHVRGDHARLDVLERANVARAARAVVMADALRVTAHAEDRDARTVLAALTIEKLNPHISCTVELMDAANESHLRVAGVEAVVMRNDLSGRMLATASRRPELMAVIMDLLTLHRGSSVRYERGPARPTRYDALITEHKRRDDSLPIAVQRGTQLITNPAPSFEVMPGDGLVVLGSSARS